MIIMKRVFYILIFFLVICSMSAFAIDGISVGNLKCEMLRNPKGIDVTKPRFSWQINTGERGVKQIAYLIVVASSSEKLFNNEGDIWNSGKIISNKSVLIEYSGKPLISRQECFWKVKVWTNKGEQNWTEPASFTMGLLQPSDWKAKWIGLDKAFPWDSVGKFARLSARYFRKEI